MNLQDTQSPPDQDSLSAQSPGRSKGPRWGVVIGIGVLAFAATAVGTALYSEQAATSNSPSAPLGSGPHVGFTQIANRPAPNFSLPNLRNPNQTLTLNSFHKPLVINFWQSGCVPCQQEAAGLAKVAKQVGSRVTFVGIDTYDVHASGLAFAHKYGVKYPLLFDSQGKARLSYNIPGFPTSFFISSNGKIVGEQIGAMSKTQLEHYLIQLFPHATSK